MKIEVVEVATGARHVVCEEPSNNRQNFVHTVLFDRDASGIYFQRNELTEHVHIQSGKRRVVATSSGFNSHVVHPSFDLERKRLVVPAESWIVRVLDESGTSILDVPTSMTDVECRGAAISPSGRLLAIYLVHRKAISTYEVVPEDVPCEVQIWDIEARVRWETVRLRHAVDRLGFTPEDDALVVTYYYATGPVALEIPSGIERWRFDDPSRPGTLRRAFDWAFSPSGELLAIAGDSFHLYNARTRDEIELAGRTWRGDCVRFSRDGKRLAMVSHGTATVFAL